MSLGPCPAENEVSVVFSYGVGTTCLLGSLGCTGWVTVLGRRESPRDGLVVWNSGLGPGPLFLNAAAFLGKCCVQGLPVNTRGR